MAVGIEQSVLKRNQQTSGHEPPEGRRTPRLESLALSISNHSGWRANNMGNRSGAINLPWLMFANMIIHTLERTGLHTLWGLILFYFNTQQVEQCYFSMWLQNIRVTYYNTSWGKFHLGIYPKACLSQCDIKIASEHGEPIWYRFQTRLCQKYTGWHWWLLLRCNLHILQFVIYYA